jgi:hypothetical protein
MVGDLQQRTWAAKKRKTELAFRLPLAAGRILIMLELAVPALGLNPASLQLYAQTASEPALHRRVDAQAVEERDSFTISRGRTTLPAEVSGAYSLGANGEGIEIDLERNYLSGYISRSGDKMSDEGTPLTFFFATSWLNGRQIGFSTRQVHGVWFSFVGTIVRGTAQTRSRDGYYRLEGNLVMHDEASRTTQSREVSLPLTRQYTNG